MGNNVPTGDEGGPLVIVEARYARGDALLIGSGAHWLLMTDPGDDSVVDALWQLLGDGGPDLDERVLAAVEGAFGGQPPALALVDFTGGTATAVSRGSAHMRLDGPARILSIDHAGHDDSGQDDVPALRRLVGGVASASRVELRPVTRVATSPPAPVATPAAGDATGGAGRPLIDGIPDEILAAKGPDGPPPPRPRVVRHDPVEDTGPSGATTDPDPGELPQRIEEGGHTTIRPPRAEVPTPPLDDHDGATVHRAMGPAAPEAPAGAPARAPHLEHHTGATVLAFTCPLGHLTPTTSPACRVCHQRIAPQEPQRVTRPVLGGLRLPTGEVVPLDRGVVIGRKPTPVPGSNDWPHLVHLPSGQSFVSRLHLHVELDGWDVLARDLNSRGGSTLTAPGRETVRMHPGEAYVLEPGTVIDLAEVYEVRFETGRVAGR
jgi:hypothetical protein